MDTRLQELTARLDNTSVSVSGSEAYAGDESHAANGAPLAVVFPRTTLQVQTIVQWARDYGVALVPSGGRTGLSGGANAGSGELVVSFERMQSLIEFDEQAGLITVEAGMPVETLQQLAAERGWFYPVDYASKGSAQIGGGVATNAGGIRVLRYGMTRDWVMGMTAVTGSGDILEIDRCLIKDNAGYDLKQLLIGSEGTLALVTQVTLRLTRPMPEQATLLIGVASLQELLDTFALLNQCVSLSAAEFFCQNALRHVCEQHALNSPFSGVFAYYLLIEFDQQDDVLARIAELLAERAVVLSHNGQQRRELWRLRELISSTLNPLKPYKNDVACRLRDLQLWFQSLEQGFQQLHGELQYVWFGHLGDGNLHLNVIKPAQMSISTFTALQQEMDSVIESVTRRFNATASAEHGIGLLKRDLLHCCRSDSEIKLYRQIKQLFDPQNILNPGKLLAS